MNRGSQRPTVVMGIGGKTEKLIDISLVKQRGIQVVRRFTGGGTVVIDQDSLFASLIGSFVSDAMLSLELADAILFSHCICIA